MFNGKNVVVIGLISGIGLGFVEVFVKLGVNIVFNGFGDLVEIEDNWRCLEMDFGV